MGGLDSGTYVPHETPSMLCLNHSSTAIGADYRNFFRLACLSVLVSFDGHHVRYIRRCRLRSLSAVRFFPSFFLLQLVTIHLVGLAVRG